MATQSGLRWPLVVAAAGALALGAAVWRRKSPEPPQPLPARQAQSVDVRRIQDEGSSTRPAPEEAFLEKLASEAVKAPDAVDASKIREESRRVFGELREAFRKMKALAEALKKTHPDRYAAEMEALRKELLPLFQSAGGLLKDSDVAVGELLKILKAEGDPLVKERLSLVLRFAPPAKATDALAELSRSQDTGDRRAAIASLSELPSDQGIRVLVERAKEDVDPGNRERAIVGLGKSLAKPSPMVGEARDTAMETIRAFTHPDHPLELRAAAWDAFGYPPRLSESDMKLVREAIHAEKDTHVKKAVQGALRRQLARMQAK